MFTMLLEFSCNCCAPIFSCDCCWPLFSCGCCWPLFSCDCCSLQEVRVRPTMSRCLPSIASAVGYTTVRPLRTPADEEVFFERVEPAEIITRNHSKEGRATRSYSHKRSEERRVGK